MKSNSQQLERIVAYLDGELSPEESAQVEQQLAADEAFRQELQGAQRAWSALDQLPMALVGDEFSRTTMEMVVDAAKIDVEAKTLVLPIQQRKRKTTHLLLIATSILLGALAARIITQNPNRRLLADLPVIHNVDIYQQFEEVEFLRDLHGQLGDELANLSLDQGQLNASLDEAKLPSVSSNRQQWIQSLSTDQQTTLRGKSNRFRELPLSKQQELRELHTKISDDPQSEQLLTTMLVYQQWLYELEPSEQFELRELSSPQRARKAANEIPRTVRNYTFELKPEELKNLFNEVQPFVLQVIRKHESDFENRIAQRSNQVRKRFESLNKNGKAIYRFTNAMWNYPEHIDAFIETVTQAIPERVREDFLQLSTRARRDTVIGWFREYHTQNNEDRRSGQVTEQELADFFVDVLDTNQKERLLALPREQMQRQLRRMYLFKMPREDRRGPPEARAGPSEGRGPRGRREGDWRDGDRPGPPQRGEGGSPRFNGDRQGFDRRRPRGDRNHDNSPRRRQDRERLPVQENSDE